MKPANDNRDEIGEALTGLIAGDAQYNAALYRQQKDQAMTKSVEQIDEDISRGLQVEFRARNSDGAYASLGDERKEAEAMLAFYQRQIDHGSAALDRGLETYRERYGVEADMERITASHRHQTHETLLERIEREARERGEDLDKPQQRDLDRDLEHDL